MSRLTVLLSFLLWPLIAFGQSEEEDIFVEANILGIFYHELGHAVIDIEQLPIFAQEEDAADVFSIYLIDTLYEEESALALAYEASLGFLAEADLREQAAEEVAWWDTHGPDEQRFFNTVCIFYGASPETREDFATDMGLPEERSEYCPDEFWQADDSWGYTLDEMIERGSGETLVFKAPDESLTSEILTHEVAQLNNEMQLREPLEITVESCGQANAFYDPQEVKVIFCTEFEGHLRDLFRSLE